MSDFIINKTEENLLQKFKTSMQKNGFCIIKNFTDKSIIKKKIQFMKSNFSQKTDVRRTGKTKFKRPNFQRLDIGDYAQINARFSRMATQFTWNNDSIFYDEIKNLVHFRNLYLELQADDFVYTIKDGKYCDIPKFLQYPIGGGFMNKHIDGRGEYYKAPNFLLSLSKRGEDFMSGGAYYYNRDHKFLDIEEIADVGDLYAHDIEIEHGVKAIDADKNVDLATLCGRYSINLSIEDFEF